MRWHDDDRDSDGTFTIAAIGDWPYGNLLFENANKLVASINADKAVTLVLHLGDIHCGSQPCTSAGIFDQNITLRSNPGYNQAVYYRFQHFEPPVVYTPGDNA